MNENEVMQLPTPTARNKLPVLTRRVFVLRKAQDHDTRGDIVIPRAAITTWGGVPGVFVLSRHGRARFRMLKIGTTSTTTAEILSGLSGTETLVLPPFRHLYDGSPIRARALPP